MSKKPSLDEAVCKAVYGAAKNSGARTVLEYGCGDWSWQRYSDWAGMQYIGVTEPDKFREVNRFKNVNIRFISRSEFDWTDTVDFVLFDESIHDLPLHECQELINRARKSGAKYIFVNSYPETRSNLNSKAGFDLRKQPFNLGEPEGVVVVGGLKRRFLWCTDKNTAEGTPSHPPPVLYENHSPDFYKDRHKGKRVFIIASGPSVNDMNLDWLRGEITIGTNQSYLALPFEPTYICTGDRRLWPRIRDELAKLSSEIICSDGVDHTVGNNYPGTNLGMIVRTDWPVQPETSRIDVSRFNHNLNRPILVGYNVIFEPVLPFAIWCGFSEIYLIGCDCTEKGRSYDKHEADVSGEQMVSPKYIDLLYDFAEWIEDSDLAVRIYNAGIGGKLGAFPRVDIETLKDNRVKKPLVVGYWTGHVAYQALANRMKESVERFGFEVKIYNPEPRGQTDDTNMNWVLNCSYAADIVLQAFEDYPERDIWFLDADAIVEKYPFPILDVPPESDCAFVYHTGSNHTDRELQSNSMLFRNTQATKDMVNDWRRIQNRQNERLLAGELDKRTIYHDAWDQWTLQRCVEARQLLDEITVHELDRVMARIEKVADGREIMPDVPRCDAIVTQHQASRKMRHIV